MFTRFARKLTALSFLTTIAMIGCASRPILKNYSGEKFIPSIPLDNGKWCYVKHKDLMECKELGKIDSARVKLFKVPTYRADRFSIRYNPINKNIFILVATTEPEMWLPESNDIDTALFAAEIDSVSKFFYYSFSGGDAAYRFDGKDVCCD